MKLVQYLITFFLLLILLGMVAGYIYYGMYLAKNAEVVILPTESVAETGSDDARRAEIINALNQDPTPISDEKKQGIINALNNPTPTPTADSEAKRAEIIEALLQN